MGTIYQSSTVSTNADISVLNHFAPYVDPDNGEVLSGGKLYFGLVGRDGRLPENRKKVYAILENGASVAVEQPVILSAGGVPQYNGSPVLLATDGSYSLAVDDGDDVQQYYAPKITAKTLLGYSGVIPEESKTLAGSSTLTFDHIEASTASFYASTVTTGSEFKGQYLRVGVDYNINSETTITLTTSFPAGTVILGRALDPTGQTVNVTNTTEPFFIYDVKATAIDGDLSIGASVLINGGDSLGDGKGGSYLVVAGGTGTADNYTFIDLNNGNQLKLKSIYQVFQGYYELLNSAALNTGKITIDPTEGNVTKLTVTENVTSIEVLNIPATGELKLQLELKQDPTTPRTITWSINGVTPTAPGGTLPTFTNTVDAVDEYIIKTNDAGSTWSLFTIGQDIK